MMERDFEERLIELIKMKYRNNEFEGEIPFHWTEEDTVDYMISKLRLRKAYCSAGKQGSLKRDEEETPLWAQKLMTVLETVEKTVIPAIIAMNEKNRERAEKEARFYDSLHTDEERKLSRPAYPPDKYPKPEEEVEPDRTKDFRQMGEEALADEELQRELEEERKKPKAYPNPPKSKPKEQVGQFPDYTQQNMEKDPQTHARIGLARATLSSLNEEERRKVVGEFIKSKTDLRFRSGSRHLKERTPAEEGKSPSTQAKNEDLRRRMFNPVTDAEKGENEAVALEEEAAALPSRIRNLAERLSKTPFGHWTAKDMKDAEKYFKPDEVRQIAEVAERRNR
jgi:hypothetical protein